MQRESNISDLNFSELKSQRENISAEAERLLGQLFGQSNISFRGSKKLNILVLGAGTFPSYLPFLKKINQNFPAIQELHFTLVDIKKEPLDIFKQYFNRLETEIFFKERKGFVIKIHYMNTNLASLLNISGEKFQIIYLEHPPVTAVTAVISECNGHKNLRDWLVELPRLSARLEENSIVMATVKTFEEQFRLERWLRYSLDAKPKTLTKFHQLLASPHRFIVPKDFFSGLSCEVKRPVSSQSINIKVKELECVQESFKWCLLIGIAAYCLNFSSPLNNWNRHSTLGLDACFLLNIATLLNHQPQDLPIKILIGVLQLSTVAYTYCNNLR